MKVKDLVEELSKFNPDMEVLCRHESERGYISYREGEASVIRPKRMVKVQRYEDDELVEVYYEPFEEYEYEISIEDSKEYFILNSEDVEDES